MDLSFFLNHFHFILTLCENGRLFWYNLDFFTLSSESIFARKHNQLRQRLISNCSYEQSLNEFICIHTLTLRRRESRTETGTKRWNGVSVCYAGAFFIYFVIFDVVSIGTTTPLQLRTNLKRFLAWREHRVQAATVAIAG